jgi:hypothetical protein
MIITTTRHGRTARDAKFLLAHLSRQDGQVSRVAHIRAPVFTETEALAYMQALRDGSRATVAFHHISLSPSAPLTEEQREEAVARVLAALEAEDHAHVVWEHSEKARRGLDVDRHYHIVVGHVGPDGRALDDSQSYARLEAVARSLEFDFGHDRTTSRRTEKVATELERIGRPDVAAHVRDERPPELPRSSISSRQRARAERLGVSLPDVREAVRNAWATSDSSLAFRAALAEAGFGAEKGDKPGVWVVTGKDGKTLGALDRLAGEKRRVVAARMQQQEDHHDPADTTKPASHASPEGDIRRGQRRQGSRRGAGSAAFPSRSDGTGTRFAAGRSDRPADNDTADAGDHAVLNRGAGHPYRRRQAALAISVLTRAAKSCAAHKAARYLRRRLRPHARDMVAVHRLARINLDEIRHLAEEIGRRAALFLTSLQRPVTPRDALRIRLRAAQSHSAPGRRSDGAAAFCKRLDHDTENPTPTYRPRF